MKDKEKPSIISRVDHIYIGWIMYRISDNRLKMSYWITFRFKQKLTFLICFIV